MMVAISKSPTGMSGEILHYQRNVRGPAASLIAAPIPVPALYVGAAMMTTVGDQADRCADH